MGHSAPSSLGRPGRSGDQGAVAISWTAGADAAEYRVYGRNQFWTVSRTSLIDTGAAGTAAAMPTAAATTWQVKNLLELKNARGVTIEYNVFENNWVDAQKGYAILFTPRNQDGDCPWCVVEDVRSVQRGAERRRRRQHARLRLAQRERADHHGW